MTNLQNSLTFPWSWKKKQISLTSGHPAWQNQQSECAPSKDPDQLRSLATHWVHSENSDQTGQMPRLIWIFARQSHFVGFVMSRLTCSQYSAIWPEE